MTQIQAIEIAERTLARMPASGVFAIPFANQRDYDRVEDAFTDLGCLTGEDVRTEQPPPFNEACRSIERLRHDFGENMNLKVLEVEVPDVSILKIRTQSREPITFERMTSWH
ncbi:MAG: hypothetical protein ACAH95_11330 [Fimbriimonas sp.]